MPDNPLFVSFLWHMHQPYYKDPFTGVYRLPWVRLHGAKDYLDMAERLENFPAIRQTFNLVPSLILQLNDYTENNATDRFLDVTLINPSDLSETDRLFILENFFLANWENMIKPFPRYHELLIKRGVRFSKAEFKRAVRIFTDQDIRDIQVLFNLSWIDPSFRNRDSFLKGLIEKERWFTEEEKEILVEKQMDILKGIIPEYKKLSGSGQIELSVTPFYHPILPLVWDTDSARVAMPDVRLPVNRFSYQEDVIKQIKMSLNYFEMIFGYMPAGMWPSEGAVSEDVVKAIEKEGIKWIATDEAILSKSTGMELRGREGSLISPASLYSPYHFGEVAVIFRDRRLSDLIGFAYSQWEPDKAADDLIKRLVQIKQTLPAGRPYLVPIILDGENCWEYYKNDGHDFLESLYTKLSNDSRLKTTTISDFIADYGSGEPLSRLHAGSWINADYGIWIGHEEDNLAWDYLSRTRRDLKEFSENNMDMDVTEAYDAVYAAEGSDWNWWYGDEFSTDTKKEFDELFRGFLMKVYKVMGRDIPSYLHVPILKEERGIVPVTPATGFIYPKIDGIMTNYYEWHHSAYVDVKRSGGSMHKSESIASALYYGFNKDNLFIRLDTSMPLRELEGHIIVRVDITHPIDFKIEFDLNVSQKATISEKQIDKWVIIKILERAAAQEIFEIEIPFKDLRIQAGDEMHFSVGILKNGGWIERCPWRGYISMSVPPPHYDAVMWH
ncbi:MAG: glycoside hydrolase family 57 protein [Nitrospirae bacterium]|nr:glycoside hydrolase family 57 protein [Nitrospirota bacterium]